VGLRFPWLLVLRSSIITATDSLITDWGDNPYALNEHFGTPDDLKSLSTALHNRGMSLMVDIVINHLAFNGPAQSVDYSLYPPPFNSPSAFHPVCDIDYGNQSSIESCWLVTSPPSLPDVKSENATVFDAIVNSVVDLVKTYDVDGIRLDTARHIPKDKLAQFQDAVGVFVTGEALNDSVQFVSQYQGPLDSALNYPLWYPLIDAILGKYSFDYLGGLIKAEETNFSDVNVLTNFLDNHDQPRLASRPGDDVVRDENAVTFLMFTSGIPVIYYGFEQRFNGGYDPINREPLWTSNYNTNATLYQYITILHRIRSLVAANNSHGKTKHAAAKSHVMQQDFFSSNVEVLGTSQEYIALQRGPLVVVVSNVGANGTTNSFIVANSQFEPNSEIIDLLSCARATVGSRREVTSTPNGGKARVSAGVELMLMVSR